MDNVDSVDKTVDNVGLGRGEPIITGISGRKNDDVCSQFLRRGCV
ncbi:hypothetical protein [Paenibacillus marinisediminis]